MKLYRICTSVFVFVALIVYSALPVNASGRLDSSLESLVQSGMHNDSLVGVLVLMEMEDEQLQRSVSQISNRPDLTRGERIKVVTSHLKSVPVAESVKSFLNLHARSQNRHWIIPSYTAMVPVNRLLELAALPGVNQVIPNVRIELTEPVDVQPAPSAAAAVSEPLRQINVPALWGTGLTGKGRLICSFDTGVDRLHPALSAKWRGNHASQAATWFSKVAPDSLPYDKVGHGTHTMGVMLGSTPTDSFGVAPDAEWICAAVVDQGPDLTTTISHILEAFEWALDPDGNPATTDDVPDVILNSWGLPTLQPSVMAPCSTIFWDAIDNIEAAGIVTIFAAGNEGRSGAMTIRNPSNRATTPYNSFCVGAVNSDNLVADFSSRGPSSCDTTQVKPEVVAPGVGIRSSYKGGTYLLMSGTSMAAPFIAGLAALCRQYNPDASVEQIKYALMQSAMDLGPVGEDNAYGWGLVDASRLLQYLPAPTSIHLAIVNQSVGGDGVAAPGETIDLQVYLASAAGNIELVNGQLVSLAPSSATILSDRAGFIFGSGGTLAVNSSPYTLALDANLVHGEVLPFRFYFRTDTGVMIDSADISLPIGFTPPGQISTHHTGSIDFSVSEFGQFGFGEGSVYNAGGAGFCYRGSENLLYEAGLIVGRSTVQLSSSIRSSLGSFRESDFRPKVTAASWMAEDGSSHQSNSYSDKASALPVPVTIQQESIHYTGEDDDFIVLKFHVINNQPERLTGMYFGFMSDFDLSSADTVIYQADLGLIYQSGVEGGTAIGLMPITGGAFTSVVDNSTGKAGMTAAEQFALVSDRRNDLDLSPSGDKMLVLHWGPYALDPLASVEITLVIVAGGEAEELQEHAVRVRERLDAVTGVQDRYSIPHTFSLAQNYPNPFNPSTTISFELKSATEVNLDIFNALGQHVISIYKGRLGAGSHRIVWEGTDAERQQVAAGVYFYRLSTESGAQTRKMVLLK